MPLEDTNGNPIQTAKLGGLEDSEGNPIQPTLTLPKPNPAPRVPDKQNPYPDINYNTAGSDAMSAQGSYGPNEQKILLEGLPIAGGMFGGIPGAAAGAFAKQALTPDDPSFGTAVADTALQGVIPAGIESVLSRGLKGGVASLLSKLPQSIVDRIPGVAKAQIASKLANKMFPEAGLVQTAASNTADQSGKLAKVVEDSKFSGNLGLTGPGLTNSMSAAETKAVAQYNARYADNQIGGQLLSIQRQLHIAGDQPLSAVPKLMMSDVKHVENAILATGNPTIVKQIASNDLVTRYFTPSTKSFNVAGMLDEMAGTKADAYKLALGKGYDTFKTLLEQGVKKGVGQETPGLFSWSQGRKLLIGGGALSAIGIPFKVGESAILGADAIRKIAQNPELGQMIIQSMRTGSKAPESTLLTKTILAGLRGTTVYLQTEDGQKDQAVIQSDPKTGEPQLQYSRQSSDR